MKKCAKRTEMKRFVHDALAFHLKMSNGKLRETNIAENLGGDEVNKDLRTCKALAMYKAKSSIQLALQATCETNCATLS